MSAIKEKDKKYNTHIPGLLRTKLDPIVVD